MLTPSTGESIRTFEGNVNLVNGKVYEEENNDTFLLRFELDEVSIDEGKDESNGRCQKPHLIIDPDLEF